jgi:hypothetical protein
VTYEEMGLISRRHRPNWYDPGRFWSGDDLDLAPGFGLGGEIEVALPLEKDAVPVTLERRRRRRLIPKR